MSGADIVVLFTSAAAAGGLGWFFFATRGPHHAVGRRMPRVDVVVRDGYRSNVIRLSQAYRWNSSSTGRKAGPHLPGGVR